MPLFIDSYENEKITPSDFPSLSLEPWDSDEREESVDQWMKDMEYRLRWIFYREERGGVNRSRYVNSFSPCDFIKKVNKCDKVHPMNTITSTFYDWNIGGSQFLMRIEAFAIKGNDCIRCHFISRKNNKEICYQDRVWDGSNFHAINMVWAEDISPIPNEVEVIA